jgi:NAD(P)-dependent dehydrogenase (short-subunit alcohol dehydrogenase family)
MIDVNLKGVLYGIAAALPVFRRQNFGHFVNVISTAGLQIVPTMAVYAGTKNAVRTITETLRQEAGDKMRVTAMEHCAPLHSACATILRRAQAVPLSCHGWRSKARSFLSLRICSRKDLPIIGWLPVRTRHYPRPPRPRPFLEPRAAGFSLRTVSPPRRWQPGLKPW